MDELIRILQRPEWQISLLIGLPVLLVLLILLYWWRSRRQSEKPVDEVERRWELITEYGQVFPSFLFILNCFRQKHALEELLAKPEVDAALTRLESFYESSTAKNRTSSSILLFPVPAARSSQVKAALLTVLRGVFDDEETARDLPMQAHQELDRFLDSLTK